MNQSSCVKVFITKQNIYLSSVRSLDHPNIVGYRGSKTLTDERVILAMETCDISLGDLIEQRSEQSAGALEPQKILRVSIDVCNALNYLHTKANLLHGDLKSYNVLIKNSFEQCKLCDFGVSLPLNNEGFVDLVKNPKARYVGTDIYSAPEVFYAPPQDISSKCDMFSFGLIIYECLTLQPPHYEHLGGTDISGMSSDLSVSNNSSMKIQSKKLFNDSFDSKENQLNASTDATAGIVSNETTLNESQADNSISIKSTAATIGDDTIRDITGTTFNGTINTATDVSFNSSHSSNRRQPMRDVNSSAFNSTLGSDSANDYSLDSMNDSTATIEPYLGTRPRLPESQQFTEDQYVFVETFYICTQGMPDERPTAGDLLTSLKSVQIN